MRREDCKAIHNGSRGQIKYVIREMNAFYTSVDRLKSFDCTVVDTLP